MVDSISLNAQELDCMRIFLFEEDEPLCKISSKSPFFQDFSQKEDLTAIAEWITNNLALKENDDWINVPQISKCVSVRTEDLVGGRHVRLNNCEKCYIYIDAPVESISISNCFGCTVVVAACRQVCTIDKCEATNVTVASTLIRIGSCADCIINSCSKFSPFLFGDNQNLKLGPHNAGYENIEPFLERVGFAPSKENIEAFATPIQIKPDSQSYSIIEPCDFLAVQLPEGNMPPSDHLMTPKPYLETLKIKSKFYAKMQNDIKK